MTLFDDSNLVPKEVSNLTKCVDYLYKHGIITMQQCQVFEGKILTKYKTLKTPGISFTVFWDLYGKKIGDKSACEKKWDRYKVDLQQKILDLIPEWKKQFTDTQIIPYPETFLNQQRWNDELIKKDEAKKLDPAYMKKALDSRLPDYWTETWYISNKHNTQLIAAYFDKLIGLGYTKQVDAKGWPKFLKQQSI